MIKKRPENNSKFETTTQRKPLKVEDIVRHLSELINLYRDPRTGNLELSDGLQVVVNVLKPYSNEYIFDLVDTLSPNFALTEAKKTTKRPKIELPPNLSSLNTDEINLILQNQDYTKDQIIDLGVQRFGIARSKLLRQSKGRVSESIRAALDHENSLDAISQEARRGGAKRTS